MRISIGACRRALSIMSWTQVGGIPLTLDGEERVITKVVVREGHWYSGEDRLTRRQQEELTQRAQAIIEDDLKRYQERFPRLPPTISIRECQEAIGIAGGIPMTAPRRGEADHRSQDRWGREPPVVQRRPSLDRERTGQAHQAGESHYRKEPKRVMKPLGLSWGT